MNQIEQLDVIDRAIKDLEIRLKTIEETIEKIDKEISILGPKKNELEQNIEFHKKEGVVPIAHEYKKAKSELSKIKSRLTLVTTDQKKVYKAYEETKKSIAQLKIDHANLLTASQNNVLRGSFGAIRGKK